VWAAASARANQTLRNWYGVPVTYMPEAGGSYTLTGIFDEAYRSWEVAGGTRVMVTAPALSVCLADLSVAPKVEDTLTVSDRDWQVVGIEPDGSGMAVLRIVEVG